jgi:hypothetical protein
VDFAKYSAMLMFQMKEKGQAKRANAKRMMGIGKQVLLLPITGGLSLIKYLLGRARGD